MLPLALDLAEWPVLLVAEGPAALQRLALLEAAGARRLRVFSAEPSAELRDRAGDRLVPHWPTEAEVAAARLLFTAGLSPEHSAELVGWARAHRVLANAEDMPALCDAYALATVRRGPLLLAVSTEGQSPAVARVLRQWLERRFGPEWEARLEQAAALRRRLRAEGAGFAAITAATADLLRPWLEGPEAAASTQTGDGAPPPGC